MGGAPLTEERPHQAAQVQRHESGAQAGHRGRAGRAGVRAHVKRRHPHRQRHVHAVRQVLQPPPLALRRRQRRRLVGAVAVVDGSHGACVHEQPPPARHRAAPAAAAACAGAPLRLHGHEEVAVQRRQRGAGRVGHERARVVGDVDHQHLPQAHAHGVRKRLPQHVARTRAEQPRRQPHARRAVHAHQRQVQAKLDVAVARVVGDARGRRARRRRRRRQQRARPRRRRQHGDHWRRQRADRLQAAAAAAAAAAVAAVMGAGGWHYTTRRRWRRECRGAHGSHHRGGGEREGGGAARHGVSWRRRRRRWGQREERRLRGSKCERSLCEVTAAKGARSGAACAAVGGPSAARHVVRQWQGGVGGLGCDAARLLCSGGVCDRDRFQLPRDLLPRKILRGAQVAPSALFRPAA
jgi:hypothetical protein